MPSSYPSWIPDSKSTECQEWQHEPVKSSNARRWCGLQFLKHIITQGWPSNIKEVSSDMQPYWTFKDELTIEDGLILKGTKIVIPNKKPWIYSEAYPWGSPRIKQVQAACQGNSLLAWIKWTIRKTDFGTVNSVSNTHNQNASSPLTWHWGKKYQYTHGQSLQQTFFILKVCPTC